MKDNKSKMLFIISMGLIILLSVSAISYAQPPRTVSYQGYLTDTVYGDLITDPAVSMRFSLHDALTGGIELWSETQSVNVNQGVYSVELGSLTPIPALLDFNSQYYLEVAIDEDLSGTIELAEKLTPRQPFTQVPYAINADTVDGAHAAALEESAEIDADILTHSSNASVHHAKTSTFPELSGQASDAQIPAAISRASEIMPTVLANDGTGSTLDADTVDGLDSSAFFNTSSDYGRPGVASDLYEGAQTLANKYVNVIGDTMTGALNLPANGLAAGTNQLVLSGGRVGIGTTTPNSKLHIVENSGSVTGLFETGDTQNWIGFLTSNGYIGYAGVFSGTDDIDIGTGTGNTTGSVNLVIGAVPKLTVNQSGNIGIGTTSPNTPLHVMAPSWNTLTVEAFSNDPALQLTSDGTSSNNDWTMRMDVSSADNLQFRYDNFAKLTLTTDGNVGIGTSTPGYPLEVRGDVYATGSGDATGGYFYGRGGSTSGSAFGTQNYARAYGSSLAVGVYSDADLGSTTGREYAFYGYGDGYFSGQVGIGTDSPEAKLHVEGQIKIEGGYYANGVLSSFGYHVDDCDGITEKFVHLAAQGGVDYGLCMEKSERPADEWGDASNTCKMAGKRLPDYTEWRKACDGQTWGPYIGPADPFYSNITGDYEWASSRASALYDIGPGAVVAGFQNCATANSFRVSGSGTVYPHTFRCVR